MNNQAPISTGHPKGTGQGFAYARWVEFTTNTYGWADASLHGWNRCNVCRGDWLNMQHALLRKLH